MKSLHFLEALIKEAIMARKTACLSENLLHRLHGDGFLEIGHFRIATSIFQYDVETAGALDWQYSVYAWVAVAGEGCVLRIGKCEGRLATRLRAYKNSLDIAMSGRLGPNEYFKGDTQPWESEGWRYHVGRGEGGLIFARSLGNEIVDGSMRDALMTLETQLIASYDPPLCGVAPSGRRAKQKWEIQHGATNAIGKPMDVRPAT